MSHRLAAGAVTALRPVAVCLLAVVTLLAVSGAASASSPSPSEGKTTLRVGWVREEPDLLNPFSGFAALNYMLWHMNYDYLVGLDGKTLEPRPELATKWEVSPDGLVWTFTLRSDAKWQDGQPVTASDVAYTFNLIIAKQPVNGPAWADGITKAVAVDDTTVKLYSKKPKGNMLNMAIPIVPEHIWSKVDSKTATTSYQPELPLVGDGPFSIVEWKRGSFIRLEANKGYWGGAPKVDEVLIVFYRSADTMVQDLKAGNLDAAERGSERSVRAARPDQRPHRQQGRLLVIQRAVDELLRQSGLARESGAVGQPVSSGDQLGRRPREDRAALADDGYATAGSSVVPPDSNYHWEPPADSLRTYDPAKANAILDAAGYKDVNGDGFRETKDGKPLKLRLWATTDRPEGRTSGKLITGWLKDIGIAVQFEVVDYGVVVDAQYNFKGETFAPDWDMMVYYWITEPAPQTLLASFTPQQIPRLERRWLDESRVHEAEPAVRSDHRRGCAEAHRRRDAERSSTKRGRTSSSTTRIRSWRGTRIRWQGWTSMPDGATRPAEVRVAVRLVEHRHLPLRRAQDGDECGLWLRDDDADRRDRGRRHRRGPRHHRAAAPSRPRGGDGVSSAVGARPQGLAPTATRASRCRLSSIPKPGPQNTRSMCSTSS